MKRNSTQVGGNLLEKGNLRICSKCGKLKSEIKFRKQGRWCKECFEEYNKRYYQDHREELLKSGNQYYQSHKKKKAKYGKQYRQTYKKEIAERNKQYYQEHCEELSAKAKLRYQDHKQKRAERFKKYYQDNREKIKKHVNQYRQMHRKEVRRRNRQYSKTEKGREARIRGWNKRQRKLGFNPLNNWFPGSVGHHINDIDVVYIPEELHTRFYTSHDVQRHRNLVLEYYGNIENMINDSKTKQTEDI